MDLAGFKILVIDDDELIRLTIRNILKKTGCSLLEAENGVTGVMNFKSAKPNVVITDMLMPDKEGLETISEIRAINASAKIIAMSGGGSTQNMAFLKLAQKIGADKILSKPFKPNELIGAIQDVLSE